MSDSEDNFTYEKFRQLLAAVGSQRTADGEQVSCVEYDFRKAHYFNTAQFGKLNDFAGMAAGFIAARFASFYSDRFDVAVSGVDQQYAADYFKMTSGTSANSFSLVFGPDQQHPAGFVDVPEAAGRQWLKQVLGDSEKEQEAGAQLSQLEQSFLFDIVSIFVQALVEACKSFGYKACGSILRGQPDLGVQPTEPLCVMGFDVKKAGTEENFRINIVAVCSAFNAVAQKVEQAASKPAPDFLADVITYHIRNILVPLTVQFDSTMLTFEEVMTLQADDVIVLDRKITDRAGIFLMGRKLFSGRLAKVGENKALVVSGPAA